MGYGGTRDLPFEYNQRWPQIRDFLKELPLDLEVTRQLEERDRNLEDYLAGLTSSDCTCSYVQAYADSFTLNLVAGTSTSGDASFTAITREYGGWTISGGQLVPPDPLTLYTVHAVCNFVDNSGADDVQGFLQITDGMGASYYQSYMPPGFSCSASGSRLASWHPSGTTLTFAAGLEAPAASTRNMDALVEVWVSSLCGCPSPTIGVG